MDEDINLQKKRLLSMKTPNDFQYEGPLERHILTVRVLMCGKTVVQILQLPRFVVMSKLKKKKDNFIKLINRTNMVITF